VSVSGIGGRGFHELVSRLFLLVSLLDCEQGPSSGWAEGGQVRFDVRSVVESGRMVFEWWFKRVEAWSKGVDKVRDSENL